MSFPDYDDFEIGLELEPLEQIVDEHRVRSYVYAVDDYNPWYLTTSPFGGPIAPPSLLNTDDLTSDDPSLAHLQTVGSQSALAARYTLRSCAPIRIGQKVLLRSKHIDKHVRRGRGYVVRQFDVLSADHGELLTSSTVTEMVGRVPDTVAYPDTPRPSERRQVIPRQSRLPVATSATARVPMNSPLESLTKVARRKQVYAFSARPGWWTSIHTEPDFARSLGLPTAIAQGLMTTGYVAELSTNFFGESWIKGGELSVAFIRPVCMEDRLVVNGVVSEHQVEANEHRVEIEVWCENQHGELVTVGQSSAKVA